LFHECSTRPEIGTEKEYTFFDKSKLNHLAKIQMDVNGKTFHFVQLEKYADPLSSLLDFRRYSTVFYSEAEHFTSAIKRVES